jgi:hypothetical protein
VLLLSASFGPITGIAISAGASVPVDSSSGEKAFGRAKASLRQLPDPRGKKKNLSAVKAACAYKELTQVERVFRKLERCPKRSSPIYHQDPQRVQAHIFVAALACLLDRLLEKKLKAAKLPFATKEALAHLRTVQLVDVALEGAQSRGVTVEEFSRCAAFFSVI